MGWLDRDTLQAVIPPAVLALLVVLISIYDPRFFSGANLETILADTMTLFLMASGLTLVIMLGGIDLSVQAVASMTSCILAAYLGTIGGFSILAAVIGGAVAGMISGLVTIRLRIPSFIATLAVGGLVTSAGFWFSDTRSVNIPRDLSDSYLRWAVGDLFGISAEIWVGIFFLIALSILLSMTPFGRFVRAVGAQERAAIASGIDVDKVKLWCFVTSGAMAGVAGIVMGARLGSGSPTLANEFLLPAIAAVIVGGTAITGGVGSVWRTLVGALIIQVVRIGMTFMGVSVFAQQIVFGLILVAAVAVTMDRSKVLVIK